MGIITHILKQTCTLITTTINDYGDQVVASTQELSCRFRDLSDLNLAPNREAMESDAMLWLEPSVTINDGDLIRHELEFYRVTSVTRARKLAGSTIEFIKCELEHYPDMSEVS